MYSPYKPQSARPDLPKNVIPIAEQATQKTTYQPLSHSTILYGLFHRDSHFMSLICEDFISKQIQPQPEPL